jgi:beta-glucosidase
MTTTLTTDPSVAALPARLEALLSQLTLEQKLGQMMMPERMAITPDEVRDAHIGAVLSGGGSAPGDNQLADWVAMNDAYWAASMTDGPDRTPIPLLYAVDAIHGHANVLGATVFPHNIGLGCAHDADLVERIAKVMADEVLATGVDWTFAPTLAVAGNPHWGRTYESFSDDPALVASYAGPYVRGVQGAAGDSGVLACAKHWIGDGGTTAGNDQGDTACTEAELERVHMAPYPPAIAAGVYTVMASFNSWNGDKCHGHRYLLTDVLKGRLGFDGLVVSDWDGVDYLHEDYGAAITMAVNAGIDMLMVSVEWKACLAHLREAALRGDIPMSRIDDAVRRILRVKLRSGLFERPRPAERPMSGSSTFGSAAHRAVAREAVRKSLVLLKNDHELLPLRTNARLLVAGKSAHNRGHQCGGFTVAWQGVTDNASIVGGTSIWEGIQAVAPGAVLSPDGSAADSALFDAAIVVIGERPYAEGMGDLRSGGRVQRGSQREVKPHTLAPYGATMELASLHAEDLALIERLRARGLPVVTLFVAGRPLVVNQELDASTAFVAAWLPGSEGAGVADVLFGTYDFTGRLAMTWPSAAGEAYATAAPRFERGHGLSYSAR